MSDELTPAGLVFRRWRKLVGGNQYDAARALGVTRSTIARCEAGAIPRDPLVMRRVYERSKGFITPNRIYCIDPVPEALPSAVEAVELSSACEAMA